MYTHDVNKVSVRGLRYNSEGPCGTWEVRRDSPSPEPMSNNNNSKSKLKTNAEAELDNCVTVSLDDSNMVMASLPGGKKFNVVVDSGATITLLGQDLVESSPYLSSLSLEPTPEYRIRIANGTYIFSKHKLNFTCNIQGFDIPISAHVVPSFGLIKCLLGTQDLKHLKANLDFEHNILKFNLPKTVKFSTPSAFYIRPHCTRYVTLKAKLPPHLDNGDIELTATKTGGKFTTTNFITHVHRAKCIIPMHNNTNKMIRLSRSACLATADSDSLKHGPTQPMSDIKVQKLKDYPFLEPNDPRLNMTNSEILHREVDLDTNCILSGQEKSEFRQILQNLQPTFSLHGEVGQSQHTIDFDLIDDQPFYIRPYSVSEQEKQIIDKELSKLVKMGILEQGVASSSSPIMLLKKKSGQTRLVADLRHLNSKIRKVCWPFPLIRDTFQKLGFSQCNVISTVDLKDAFHSLKLSVNSQKHAGISSYYGGRTFVYKKLPQGASLSPWAELSSIKNSLKVRV